MDMKTMELAIRTISKVLENVESVLVRHENTIKEMQCEITILKEANQQIKHMEGKNE